MTLAMTLDCDRETQQAHSGDHSNGGDDATTSARSTAADNAHPGFAKARLILAAATVLGVVTSTVAALAAPPPIRMHAGNRVPACVTPARLMNFLTEQNPRLEARHRDIAEWYRRHGEKLRVRWDYAFFQMLIETNYLTFRRPDGRPGDVNPRQNNFAGIGTTGGGVPGDRFPDVGTGVLAQMQHLVAYSGERIEAPVAPRTALKQDDIVDASRRLGRPVRFSDLARRWAADPRYARSIEFIAEKFRAGYCRDAAEHEPSSREAAGTERWRRPTEHLGGPAVATAWDTTVLAPSVPAATAPQGKTVVQTARAEKPSSVAALRPIAEAGDTKRAIVRTIWRRGDPPLGAGARSPAKIAPAEKASAKTTTAAPAPARAAAAQTSSASPDHTADALAPRLLAPPSLLEQPQPIARPAPAERSAVSSASSETIAPSQPATHTSGLIGGLAVMALAMETARISPKPALRSGP